LLHLDAVVDISSNLNGIELFEFGLSGNANALKSQNILENIMPCSKNLPALIHEKSIDGKDVLQFLDFNCKKTTI
jgi:hypothetical protein